MKKAVISVDCDDVLVASASYIVNQHNQRFGTSLTADDFYGGDTNKWRGDSATITQRITDIMLAPGFRRVLPVEGAVDVMRELSDEYEFHVVTGRDSVMTEVTQAMIATFFEGLINQTHFTGWYTGGPKTKADVCREIGAVWHIDDHPHHIEVVTAAGIPSILFGEYIWTRDAKPHDLVYRAANWQEIKEIIRG